MVNRTACADRGASQASLIDLPGLETVERGNFRIVDASPGIIFIAIRFTLAAHSGDVEKAVLNRQYLGVVDNQFGIGLQRFVRFLLFTCVVA